VELGRVSFRVILLACHSLIRLRLRDDPIRRKSGRSLGNLKCNSVVLKIGSIGKKAAYHFFHS
jgi:hypothetical protein